MSVVVLEVVDRFQSSEEASSKVPTKIMNKRQGYKDNNSCRSVDQARTQSENRREEILTNRNVRQETSCFNRKRRTLEIMKDVQENLNRKVIKNTIYQR